MNANTLVHTDSFWVSKGKSSWRMMKYIFGKESQPTNFQASEGRSHNTEDLLYTILFIETWNKFVLFIFLFTYFCMI